MKTLKKLTGMGLKPLMLFAFAAILLSACKKYDNTPDQDSAALNVVNASPGPLTINFYLDNVFVNGPALSYTESSGYLAAYTGTRKFDATSGGTNQSILTSNIELKKDAYYTLFVAGQNTSLTSVLTEDDLTAPSAGKAKIRFVQLSPDAASLSLGIQGGTSLFTNQAFKASTAFVEIAPAAYTFELTNGESVASTLNLTLESGKIYTVWSRGLVSGSGTTALGLTAVANN